MPKRYGSLLHAVNWSMSEIINCVNQPLTYPIPGLFYHIPFIFILRYLPQLALLTIKLRYEKVFIFKYEFIAVNHDLYTICCGSK